MKKFLILSFLLFGSVNSMSETVLHVKGPVIPTSLSVVDDAGNTYINMGTSECGESVYRLHPDHKKYNAIFSILLAAQMGGAQVSIKYYCPVGVSIGTISAVYLIK